MSVIIPTFDRAALLIELLDALARQSWPAIEIIVVDDGATDDTQARIDGWHAAHQHVTLKRLATPNIGCGGARNAGLAVAEGSYVYFIDDDDIIFPTSLARMVAAIERSDAPYCVGHAANTDLHLRPLPDTQGRSRFVRHNPVACRWMPHAALYRCAAIVAAGGYDPGLDRNEDVEFVWRMVTINGPGVQLDDIVAARRIHGMGHMSIGLPTDVFYRGVRRAVLHFARWAVRQRQLTPGLVLGVLKSTLLCSIRIWVAQLMQASDPAQRRGMWSPRLTPSRRHSRPISR